MTFGDYRFGVSIEPNQWQLKRQPRMNGPQREHDLPMWMGSSISGDAEAYRRFLASVTLHLRAMARRRCARCGVPDCNAEDIVQEVLLTIHLKRGTLDPSRPIGPWISILVRNKLVDTLRRRGRTVYVPIDDVIDTLAFEQIETGLDHFDISRLLGRLSERQRDIVQSISIEGASVRETALRLGLSEGAVRTALHRALARLAALYQNDLDARHNKCPAPAERGLVGQETRKSV